MRGLSNNRTSNRSKSRCSFCRNPNHQVSACPHIPIVWASLQQGIIPLDYMQSLDENYSGHHVSRSSPLSRWYSHGSNWGDLYKVAERSFDKYQKAQERAKTIKKGKKRSATQTCGYCGEKGHTRRTCTHLSTLKQDLVRANRNFRTWFYKEYVAQHGLSTGCIVEFDVIISGGYQKEPSTHTMKSIVTEINWDSINLFSTFEKMNIGWREHQNSSTDIGLDRLNNVLGFVQSDVLLKIPFSKAKYPNIDLGWYYRDGTPIAACLPVGKQSHCFMDWEKQSKIGYNSPITNNLRVVSPAPQVLADDWIDGYSDEMSIILKKFSQEELNFTGIAEHIREWANKSE